MRKQTMIMTSFILGLTLLTSCNANVSTNEAEKTISPVSVNETSTESANEAEETSTSASYSISEEKYPLYYLDTTDKSELSVYFVNGGDIPYISMDESLDMMNRVNENVYELKYDDKDHSVMTRENTSYDADFDFDKDVITFFDYDAFLRMEGSGLLDVFNGYTTEGFGPLFKQRYSNDRYGKVMSFDLAAYEIDLIKEKDGWYIPLQTFSDLFLSHFGYYSLFNKDCVIIGEGQLNDELSDIYYSGKGTVSDELAKYSYNELCLALDSFYGLKETHKIDSFDDYFFETGISKALRGTDPVKTDEALIKLINSGLDDLHSSFSGRSYMTEEDALDEVWPEDGPWGARFKSNIYAFGSAREEVFPDGVPPYEEVGNTAYITFDKFTPPDENIDYMSDPKEEELYDVVRLIQYSCDQILRPDSPVENVVMDLSNNTGGFADTAAYVIADFLGRGEVNIVDTLTGATSTSQYVIDTNRDGKFDTDDTVAEKGLNLYCLISPVSFSCGNLVPYVFKSSPYVTVIGQTSGGGSCSIGTFSTARGSMFNISSNYRLSLFKNGSFYDIDRGADPDIYIAKIADYYDRESLTKMINNIY